ncbi:MAG TPA: PQQ-binding-like beta-propeller repeat protein [Actinomycetota bacterium]
MTLAGCTLAVVLGMPLVALAEWPQFQGGPSHDGLSDGPSAPLEVAWRHRDIAIDDADVTGGLSSPIVGDDGTIVVVGPHEVFGFDAEDGSEVFTAPRDLGPSVTPAIGSGPDGPVVVFAEGFGDRGPATTASPTASPNASPSAPPGEEGHTGSHLVAIDLPSGETVWPSSVPLEDVVRTPVTADETAAYVGDYSGHVTAVELSSGELRWSKDLGSSIAGAVTVDGDRALVATVGEQQTLGAVVALDRSTGEELWRTGEDAVQGNLVSGPVVADGMILVFEPGSVIALEAAEGRFLWRSEIVNPLTTPFSPQGISTLAPVMADGTVYAVDVTGRAYGLDAETGTVLWDHAVNDPSPLTPPMLNHAHLLVPTNSGSLYAIDRRTGHLAFRIYAGDAFLRGLADAGDVLVAVTGVEDAEIVAFAEDPDGVLTDEPSPTTFELGGLLAGFALGGLPVAIVALALAWPLQRRLGPTPRPGSDLDPEEEAG